MLLAFAIWFLDLFGVAPAPEDFLEMERAFRDRGHHVALDFGGFYGDYESHPNLGLGYEYYVDRKFHAVSIDVVGETLGSIIPNKDSDWFVGGGFGYHPVRWLKLFAQGGSLWVDDDPIFAVRAGLGVRFMFFHANVMPYFRVQSTADGQFSFGVAGRIEY